MAGSANIGDHHAMFEPVHGSAPKHAGKGIVNPIASISSVQMMLDWLGRRNASDDLVEVAELVGTAIADHVREGKQLTYDLGGNVHHGRAQASPPVLPMPSRALKPRENRPADGR